MGIELIPLCEIDITLGEPIVIGEGSQGLRLVYEVASGTIAGDRLRGVMHGNASADWVLVHGAIGTVDVRATFVTDDGAVVLATYGGRTDLAGGDDGGAGPIYVAPTFETGDDRYAWLNAIQAVGKGTLDGSSLRYEWYEVR